MADRQTALLHDLLQTLGYNPDRPPLYLTDVETAKVLRLKRSTLAIWRSTGRQAIPYTKLGRCIYYRPSDLVDFLQKQTKEPFNA